MNNNVLPKVKHVLGRINSRLAKAELFFVERQLRIVTCQGEPVVLEEWRQRVAKQIKLLGRVHSLRQQIKRLDEVV